MEMLKCDTNSCSLAGNMYTREPVVVDVFFELAVRWAFGFSNVGMIKGWIVLLSSHLEYGNKCVKVWIFNSLMPWCHSTSTFSTIFRWVSPPKVSLTIRSALQSRSKSLPPYAIAVWVMYYCGGAHKAATYHDVIKTTCAVENLSDVLNLVSKYRNNFTLWHYRF